jgi:hypothetical protein
MLYALQYLKVAARASLFRSILANERGNLLDEARHQEEIVAWCCQHHPQLFLAQLLQPLLQPVGGDCFLAAAAAKTPVKVQVCESAAPWAQTTVTLLCESVAPRAKVAAPRACAQSSVTIHCSDGDRALRQTDA